MTKLRAPLSIDDALARIAGQVPGGWAAMAAHVSYHERTVRSWGDAEREEQINLSAAIALDLLFQRHGGVGQPLYEAYGHLLGTGAAQAFADQFAILRSGAEFVHENGEAEEAVLRLALPDADEDDRRIAVKELMDCIRKGQSLLHMLGASPPDPHCRAPP